MKKKIMLCVAALAFVAIVGLNVKMNSQEDKLADLSLANVEALAQGEVNVTKPCYYKYASYCTSYENSEWIVYLNVKPIG